MAKGSNNLIIYWWTSTTNMSKTSQISTREKDSWDTLRKATSITKKDTKRKKQIFNFINIAHVSLLRNWYTIRLLNWHIWERRIMIMILYVPNNMHSSQVTHICNKKVSLKSLQEPHDFQIRISMPWNKLHEVIMLEKYAWRRYLLPRYQW
jgi:hypothetical protein